MAELFRSSHPRLVVASAQLCCYEMFLLPQSDAEQQTQGYSDNGWFFS